MSFRVGRIRFDFSFYFFALLAAFFILEPDGAAACGALAALVHEAGHLAVMLLIPGCRVQRVRVGACGVRISTRSICAEGWVLVCVAGAATNLFLATLTFPFAAALDSRFLYLFASSNICMGVINLLPIEPMDGGQLMRALMLRRNGAQKVDRVCFFCSLSVLVLLLGAGLWLLMSTRYNFSLLLLGLSLLGGILKEYI